MEERSNGPSVWVRWGLPLVLSALLGMQLLIFNILSARQDRSEARLDAFATASLADRRDLATRQTEMTTRQVEQFDRIMSELAQLRLDVSKLK